MRSLHKSFSLAVAGVLAALAGPAGAFVIPSDFLDISSVTGGVNAAESKCTTVIDPILGIPVTNCDALPTSAHDAAPRFASASTSGTGLSELHLELNAPTTSASARTSETGSFLATTPAVIDWRAFVPAINLTGFFGSTATLGYSIEIILDKDALGPAPPVTVFSTSGTLGGGAGSFSTAGASIGAVYDPSKPNEAHVTNALVDFFVETVSGHFSIEAIKELKFDNPNNEFLEFAGASIVDPVSVSSPWSPRTGPVFTDAGAVPAPAVLHLFLLGLAGLVPVATRKRS
jgi:hypothetical protein